MLGFPRLYCQGMRIVMLQLSGFYLSVSLSLSRCLLVCLLACLVVCLLAWMDVRMYVCMYNTYTHVNLKDSRNKGVRGLGVSALWMFCISSLR